MIVRLSTRQFGAVSATLPPWLYEWVVEEGQVAEYGKKLEVLLLPDAWLEISDWVITRHLMSGGRRATPTLFDAVRRILKATNARQAHPAFHGQAVMGRNFEVLPAWEWWPKDREWHEAPDGRTHWSPWIPSLDDIAQWKLCNLWPEHSRKGGEVITEWHHSTMALEGAISENAYTRFINARAAAAGSPIT